VFVVADPSTITFGCVPASSYRAKSSVVTDTTSGYGQHTLPRARQDRAVGSATHPPEVLQVDATVQLRRHHIDDAEAIAAAVAASLPELRPWMPWASEDAARAEVQRSRLEVAVPHWDQGSEYEYVVLVDGRLVGSVGLHARVGAGALEIGYWMRSDHTGRGIATACTRALTAAALALPGIERVEIHCDEANARGSSIPRRLGFRLARVQADEITAPGEVGSSLIWVYPPAASGPTGPRPLDQG
jgi:RimJ/RimL family protein N-acetyltransferase